MALVESYNSCTRHRLNLSHLVVDKVVEGNLAHEVGDEKGGTVALERFHMDVDCVKEMAGHSHSLASQQISRWLLAPVHIWRPHI